MKNVISKDDLTRALKNGPAAIVQLLTVFGLKEQPRKIEYFWVLQDTLIAAYALEGRSQLPEGTLETLCREFGEFSDAMRVAFYALECEAVQGDAAEWCQRLPSELEIATRNGDWETIMGLLPECSLDKLQSLVLYILSYNPVPFIRSPRFNASLLSEVYRRHNIPDGFFLLLLASSLGDTKTIAESITEKASLQSIEDTSEYMYRCAKLNADLSTLTGVDVRQYLRRLRTAVDSCLKQP